MSQVSASHLGWANAYIGYGFFFFVFALDLSDRIIGYHHGRYYGNFLTYSSLANIFKFQFKQLPSMT
jgi:hypothetical protein